MKLITRILRLLDGGISIEQKHIVEQGLCEPGQYIVIRKTLCERSKVSVLIHECVHWLYPDLPEFAVLLVEYLVFKNLTDGEYGHLLFHLQEE